MKKALLLLLISLFITGCSSANTKYNYNNEELYYIELCKKGGGKWANFGSIGGDKCGVEDVGAALSTGCDCGVNKCWNGELCVKE